MGQALYYFLPLKGKKGSEPFYWVPARIFPLARGARLAEHLDMPRSPRIAIAGLPLHIVQRGNNRQACFVNTKDYETYLRVMEEASGYYGVHIHAYVLMTNHVHLLVTPYDESSASKMMQQIGRRYVLYFNKSHRRSGTLWEGRFRSSLVETDDYLLACQRYIELNPVRASIVSCPSLYRWSSYRANALGEPASLITPHSVWTDLSSSAEARYGSYRKLFAEEIDARVFRSACQKGLPVGSANWRAKLESEHGVHFGTGKQGRPAIRKKGF